MKKFLIIFIVLCILFSTFACSSVEEPKPNSEILQGEVVKPKITESHDQVKEGYCENTEDSPTVTPENNTEDKSDIEVSDNSASQSDSQGFLNRDVYYSIEDYEKNFSTKEENEDTTKSNSRLVLYHKEKFIYLKYELQPDSGMYRYDFIIEGGKIIDENRRSFCDVTYGPVDHYKEFETSMKNNSEEIKLDSPYVDKVLYRHIEGNAFATYLIYINEEPVVVRFFHTDKEAAIEILEGCEFVAPEEITK